MITYEKAKQITEETEVFYEKIVEVKSGDDTYKVSLFNYMLATGDDFVKYNAHEMRGLTFIHVDTPNGVVYDKWLSLPKFFNINENKYTLLEDFKNKEVLSISLKEDGSLLQPIKLPNGEIVWKTKMSFDNDQTKMATEYFNKPENKVLKDYIEHMVDDYILLFELVSPFNRIVVPYQTTELRLLTIRDRFLGGWSYPVTTNNVWYDQVGIKTASQLDVPREMLMVSKKWYKNLLGEPDSADRKQFNSFNSFKDEIVDTLKGWINNPEAKTELTILDLLIISRDYIIDEEGFVITFGDLTKAKLKHTDYLIKHKLSEEILQENIVIGYILDETIDDVLAQLDEKDERKDVVRDIEKVISHYFDHRINEAVKLRFSLFNEFNIENDDGSISTDFASFAKENGKDINFHLVMKTKHMSFSEDFRSEMSKFLIQEIKHNTRKLEMARKFLENLKG